jgi:hypothetical protein
MIPLTQVSKVVKFIETKSRMDFTGMGEQMESYYLMDTVSFRDDEKF